MRRPFQLSMIIIVLATTALQAQKLDDLMKQHLKALGGQEVLESVESFLIMGARYTDDRVSNYKLYSKGEKKFRNETTTDGQTRITGNDGKEFWRDGEVQQNRPDGGRMGGEGGNRGGRTGGSNPDREAMRARFAGRNGRGAQQDVTASIQSPLYRAFKNGDKMKVKGQVYVEGVKTIQIESTDSDKNVTLFFLDADLHVVVKTESTRQMGDAKISVETFYSDYQDVDGILVAHAMNQRINSPRGERVTDIVLASVEINPDLDDQLFEKPKK